MKLGFLVIFFVLTSLTATTTAAMADEIRLRNGDRLTGEVVKMEEGQLSFKTSYAGEVTVTWSEIAEIRTEASIYVLLSDDTSISGIATATDEGKLKIDTEKVARPATMDLGQVKFIGRKPRPPIRISGNVSAGLDVQRGNTDTDTYYAEATVVARTDEDRGTFYGRYDREKAEGIDTVNKWLTYLDYNRFLSERLFAFGNATFESDEFKDLNLRSTLSAGVGYQVFDTPKRNLDVKGGLAYVDEDYDIGEDYSYPAFTWGLDYEEWFFDKIMQFFHHHQGLIDLGDPNKTVIRTRTGLRFPLPKGFSTTLQYNWDWDNQPAPGTDRVDTRALVLIGYNF